MEVVKNHALIVIVIIFWTSISDPECAVGGCRGSAAGEERDPEHGSTSSATSRASVSGSEPHRDPAVRTARNRENTAGQSRGHGMFHDLPQVRTFHQLSVVLPEACSDVGLWRLRLINVCWKLMFLFVCCCLLLQRQRSRADQHVRGSKWGEHQRRSVSILQPSYCFVCTNTK